MHAGELTMRRHIPNSLTLARFAAVPVFVILYVRAGDAGAWWAGVVFALAAITDQVDGFLARRWHVESAFGKVADPLADRVMIGVAAVLLGADGRIPWLAVVIIVGRDLLLVVGYRLVVPHGYTFEVSELGKAATWVLYLGVTCAIVTDASAAWPEWVVWLGIVLALVAAAQYVLKARREMNPSRERHDRRE